MRQNRDATLDKHIFQTKVRTYLQVYIKPMATLHNKWLRAISLLALFIGVFFVINAFGKKEEAVKEVKKAVQEQTWYYQLNSTDAGQINNPENYALTKPDESINCGIGPVVCSIQDIPDPLDENVPNFSHGDVTSNPTPYERSLRTPF